MKQCRDCGCWQDLGSFYRNRRNLDGLGSYCKPCNDRRAKKHNRKHHLKRSYNLTIEKFDQMASAGCKACGSFKRLVVDHNHKTGEVRGVLCHSCNLALGHVQDSPQRLRSLIQYLEGV